MKYERVHDIWHYYDGVRIGIADLEGTPHYFVSQFDMVANDYSDYFKLYPVEQDFMERAVRMSAIYRAWERKYHEGHVELASHPGVGGVDPEYDELKSWLDAQIVQLQATAGLFTADFRTLPNQDALPTGMLRELEVRWSPSSAQKSEMGSD